jgi:hypothetical protein
LGKPTNLPTQKTKDGYEATFAPLETGPHLIRVDFDNKELPKSPYPANVELACDISKVDIKGLEKRELPPTLCCFLVVYFLICVILMTFV